MPETPTWPELVALMTHGPDLPLRGRIRHDDGGEGTHVAYGSYPGDARPAIAGTGAGAASDVVAVWSDAGRLRLENDEGAVTLICDGTTLWHFTDEDAPPRELRPEHLVLGAFGTDLLERVDVDRRRRDRDGPSGPITPTTHCGRSAYAVDLPPLSVVVDAETGVLLQSRDDSGRLSEWSELVVGEDLDPDLFTWDGPVLSLEQQRAEARRAEADREQERDSWAAEHLGTTELVVEVRATLQVFHHEPDGSFHGELEGVGSLARRPRQAAPWTDAPSWGGRTHRWSDDDWDWALTSHEATLADGALAQVQRQLGSVPTTPMTPERTAGPTSVRLDDDPATLHRAVAARFSAVVDAADATADWDAPAPVAGWTARDVVRHLVEWFPAFLESGAGIAIPSGPSVDRDPAAAWHVHADAVQALLDDPGTADLVLSNPHLGEVPLPEAVSRFYTVDVLMHTWDLATATGRPHGIDPDVAAELLAGMEPMDEVLRASGQYGPRVDVPADADPVSRLMGFVGRQV